MEKALDETTIAVDGTMAELLGGFVFATFPSTAMAVSPLAIPLLRRLPLTVSAPLDTLRTLGNATACQRLLDELERVQPLALRGAFGIGR